MAEEHLGNIQVYLKFLLNSNTTWHSAELGTQNEMVQNGFLSESKLQSIKELSLC